MIRVSDILTGSMGKYLLSHKLSYKQKKVVNKIINCYSENSPELIFRCTNKNCDYTESKKKPCRDRHCNRCNNNKKLKWVLKLIKEFPPLPYYHIVFTLPSEVNNLFICNQKLLYDMFFKSSFYVLNKFAADAKFFGGQIGYIGLLHTWGQRLNYHPHIHFIVTAGGIKNGEYKRLPYHKDFIFPVKAMSKVMMGKFIGLIKERYKKGKLSFPGKLESISSNQAFNNYLYDLSKKKWVIYSKKPIPQSNNVLEYISRYTHKVAISNGRIKNYSQGKVSFQYSDYKQRNKKGVPEKRIMKLEDTEFIRRYLLHILPNGFRKIRYGGMFASNKKLKAINIIKQSLEEQIIKLASKIADWVDTIEKQIKTVCPFCNEKMLPRRIVALSGYI